MFRVRLSACEDRAQKQRRELLTPRASRLQGMNPGAPVLQAAGGEGALLGAHFQVGQKQFCGVSGPEVGVSR